MKNVFVAILVWFTLLTVAFVAIGGSFDKQFWLTFLPGLMENLAVLALAIFVINGIFKRERLGKLEQTNAGQSRFVLFLTNRLAYLVLEYLGLATKDELHSDPELNLTFARNRFKDTKLATIFYGKLMESKDKEAFTNGFTEILTPAAEAISKALDQIYPRPDPGIKQIAEQMNFSIGMVAALKILFEAFKRANLQVDPDKRLATQDLDLLIRLAYEPVGCELGNIQDAIILFSRKAEANEPLSA